ncbi:MAG: methyltransferase RsmF C-terminal domain-like protein [Bradymonadia bacterium]
MLVYESFKPLDDQMLLPKWCENHFDIAPIVFDGYTFWRRQSGKGVWITAPGFRDFEHPSVAAMGMLVMRQFPPKGKPTSVFLQRFGQTATRNVYDLQPEQVDAFLRREPILVTPVDDKRGYALVRSGDQVIGCGRISGRTLISEIPKHWLAELGH